MPSSTPCVREPMRFAHLLLPLLLAGCIQGGAPSAPGDAVAPAAAPDAAAAPPALGTNATAEAPVVTIVAVSYEGRTRTSACVPSGPNACRGAPGAMPGENEWYFVEAEGVPQGLSLTVTWDAATPATKDLEARLLRVTACGESCYEGTGIGDAVTGPSPLSLSVAQLELADGEELVVVVGNADLAPRPPMLYGHVSLAQAFKVQGELRTLAPAA